MATGRDAAGGGGGGGAEPRFVVPFLRNAGFVGREEDLAELHALLQKGEAVGVRPVAAAGMGGIGKTQLAVEYAYRHRDDYPGGVYWVNAANDWQAELAALAERVGLREDDAPESLRQQRLALAFAAFLEAHPGALVIFDNVEEPLALRDPAQVVVPAKLQCRLLFTTRRRDRDAEFASFEVRVLPEDFALRLLLSTEARRPLLAQGASAEREAARAICAVLGYLPLAVVLAAAYLGKSPRVSLADYLGRLRRDGALAAVDEVGKKVDPRLLGTRHDAAVEATLAAQWEALGSEDARRVLKAAALLGEAKQVSRGTLSLLTGLSDVAAGGYGAPLEEALAELAGWSLVEELGEREIRLHPLVREFAERRIGGRSAREEFATQCAQNLGDALWDMGRLNDEVVARGVDAVLGDLRVGVRLSTEGEAEWIDRLKRPLDRESHRLRRWQPTDMPGFLLQQLRNRYFELEDEDGRQLAEAVLAERDLGHLRERFRTGRDSEALIRTLEGHTDQVNDVSVTADGRLAVSASHDTTLRVWDLGSGQLIRTLDGHAGWVTGAAVTPDGRWAVSASYDKTLRVWDLGTGQLVRTLEGHTNWLTDVTITADGRWAVSASEDKTLRVWNISNGHLTHTLEGHTGRVTSVAVTPDGNHAVSASWDKTLKVWDLHSGQLVRTLQGHRGWVTSVAVAPDGRLAVSASEDMTLRVWHLGSGQLIDTLDGHTSAATSVAVTPDGQWIISASEDMTLKIWSLDRGQLLRTLQGHVGKASGVAVSANGLLAVSASHDKTLKAWNISHDQPSHATQGHTSAITCLAVTRGGSWAITASDDETLKTWDLITGELVHTLEDHAGGVTALAVTADGQWAVAESYDHENRLNLWHLRSGKLAVQRLKREHSLVTGVAVTPDGRGVAPAHAYDSGTTRENLGDQDLARTFGKRSWTVTGATTRVARWTVYDLRDATITVWDIESGQIVHTLEGHTRTVTGVAVTADGRLAVSASVDRTLKVWDLGSGQLVHTLEGHTDAVWGVATVGNSRMAISVSSDMTLRMWDLTTGLTVAMLETPAQMTCCAVASDHLIVAGDEAGALHVLDWHPPGHPVPTLSSAVPRRPARPARPCPPPAPEPSQVSAPSRTTTPLAAPHAAHTDVLLVTVTKPETQAILAAADTPSPPPQSIDGRIYFDLGDINGTRVRLTRCEMGAGGLGGAQQAITKAIDALSPQAVIMVGIAFGISEARQAIGDILVTEQLRLYDLARVGTHDDKPAITLRGDKAHATASLINLYKSAELSWTGAPVRFGTLLTGDKLVDNLDYRDALHVHDPEAIGGEMEGAGLYTACHDAKVDWILIKAICDFADGNKSNDKAARQTLAARNAAAFALHALRFVKVTWNRR